jgi:hypothetical protein
MITRITQIWQKPSFVLFLGTKGRALIEVLMRNSYRRW